MVCFSVGFCMQKVQQMEGVECPQCQGENLLKPVYITLVCYSRHFMIWIQILKLISGCKSLLVKVGMAKWIG